MKPETVIANGAIVLGIIVVGSVTPEPVTFMGVGLGIYLMFLTE